MKRSLLLSLIFVLSSFAGCLDDVDPDIINGQADGSKVGGTFDCTLPNTILTFQLGTNDDWDPSVAEAPLPDVPANLMGIVLVSKIPTVFGTKLQLHIISVI